MTNLSNSAIIRGLKPGESATLTGIKFESVKIIASKVSKDNGAIFNVSKGPEGSVKIDRWNLPDKDQLEKGAPFDESVPNPKPEEPAPAEPEYAGRKLSQMEAGETIYISGDHTEKAVSEAASQLNGDWQVRTVIEVIRII